MMMKLPVQQFGFSRKLVFLTLLAAFGPAHADDDEMAGFIKPSSSVSIGLGAVSGDGSNRTIFGQYNGLRKDSASLQADFDVIKRDDAAGLWTTAEGRDIGLDNRELRFSQQKQGDWKYSAEYSEMVRRDPRTINTNLQGGGTANPVAVNLATPGTGPDLNLDLKRKGLTLSAEKWLTPNLLFEASFKHEDKDGARVSGVGNYCSNVIGTLSNTCNGPGGSAAVAAALLMLPEPINTTTRQFEARLNYSGDSFTLNGGYYGSFFTNSNGSLNPGISGNWGPFATAEPGKQLGMYLTQPFALPPDNQAHQVYVSGTYALTPTLRTTFKVAQTHATQNEGYGNTIGLAGSPSSLGGAVDTTLAQFGLTGRPIPALPKLSVVANWRFEDRADKTPLDLYNTPNSFRKVNSKLEGSYPLPDNYKATLGVDYSYVDRSRPASSAVIPATSITALREETEELGYRAEVRRSLSETLNASIGYGHARRDGNQWRRTVSGYPSISDAAIASSGGALPMTMMDRTRDKLKISADWTPMSTLSLQFLLEDGKDKYSGPAQKGLRDTDMKSYGVDATLALSDTWKMTGYVNRGDQTLRVDHSAGYMAALDNETTSVGIGLAGKVSGQLDVGADLSYMNDRNRYNQSMSSGAAIVDGLPDVTYRVVTLKLFGKYALDKNADIRVDLVHQSARFNEWTWVNNGTSFAYTDNTTVSMQPNQSVSFLGARYIYKFR